jgi:hypothetical protein
VVSADKRRLGRRTRLPAGLALGGTWLALLACNAVLGIEEANPRRDAGPAGGSGGAAGNAGSTESGAGQGGTHGHAGNAGAQGGGDCSNTALEDCDRCLNTNCWDELGECAKDQSCVLALQKYDTCLDSDGPDCKSACIAELSASKDGQAPVSARLAACAFPACEACYGHSLFSCTFYCRCMPEFCADREGDWGGKSCESYCSSTVAQHCKADHCGRAGEWQLNSEPRVMHCGHAVGDYPCDK